MMCSVSRLTGSSKGLCRTCCWLLFLSAMLAGCSRNTGEDYFDNYSSRLYTVLALEPQASASSVAWPRFPKRRSLQFSDPAANLDFLDFLSLYGCDLQVVVAEQNASLGKLARPSQSLLFHLRFLQATPACLRQLREQGKQSLAEQLALVQSKKQESLDRVIWQAVLGGDEARDFWKAPAVLGDYPNEAGMEPILAINALKQLIIRWQNGEYTAGAREFESLLAGFRSGDGGALLRAGWQLRNQLLRLNAALASFRSEKLLCLNGRPNFDLQVLDNVVQKFFVGEVQVWASELNRRRYALMEPYQELEALLGDSAPSSYTGWRKEREQLFSDTLQQMREHVRLIGALREGCDEPA